MGLNPLKISDGFEQACALAIARLEEICEHVDIHANNNESLVEAAMTSLGSKVVSQNKRKMAELAVKAVL